MAPPHYDVQLDNGLRFNNLPADRVEAIARGAEAGTADRDTTG